MRDNKIRIRLQRLFGRDKSYPISFVWTKKKKKNKRQSKESMRPSHSKHCSYAFVYVYMLMFGTPLSAMTKFKFSLKESLSRITFKCISQHAMVNSM